ncbi:MAG TPA: EAL domain-containing protein [Anaerolineales bacterium]|nr:EAL domain-containing protein [Anaerolineales bacterium]
MAYSRDVKALLQTESIFRILVEQIPAVVYIDLASDAGETVYISPHVQQMLGYSPKDWMDKPDLCYDLIHPQDLERVLQEMRNGIDNGRTTIEYRYIAKNGNIVWVYDDAVLIKNQDGKPEYWQGVLLDITERKQAEEALHRLNLELEDRVQERTGELQDLNEKLGIELKERIRAVEALRNAEIKYQSLVENIPAAVYIWELGENGVCRYISPQIEQMLGFSVAEWLADPDLFFRQVHPDDRANAMAMEKDAQKNGEPLRSEFRMLTREGQIVWIRDEAVVLPPMEGRRRLNQGFLYNITERKQAEATLQESQERYALALAGANDGLWDWNLKTNEIFFSPRWKSMLGYSEDEINNNPDEWFKRVHPNDHKQVQTDLVSHLEGYTSHFQSEYRIRHANGSDLWVLSRGLAVRDTEGRAHRMAGSQSDITARKLAEERLAYDALHDPLTGLPNRVLFMDRLENRLERTRRNPNDLFAIMFIDLDRFKVVNDSLGHAVGDQLLVTTAHRLRQCVRPEDTVARLSGDEFAVLLDRVNDVGDTVRVAHRIKAQLVTTALLGPVERSGTASIGIVMFNDNYLTAGELVRDADSAMYRAKAMGGNSHQLFDAAMYTNAVALLQIEGELKRAVERKEWLVYYQPIVSLARNETVGVEALVRWLHPQRGILPPQEFIQVAEDTGLILPIGEYVLRAACQQVKAWRDAGRPNFWVSVNISGRQFLDQNLVEKVAQVLAETGLPSDGLRLEITERVAIRDMDHTTKIINNLVALGVHASLDDFGTGYSSLSYLKQFPLKVLKIDQSFIHDIQLNKKNESLITAIIVMARSLGLEVVAEGVEKEEQLEFLRTERCDHVQGFLLSRPASASDLTKTLNINRSI